MATISNTLRLQDKMSSTLSTITKAMHSTLLAMESIKGANVGAEFKNAASDIKQAQKAVDDFNKSLNNSKDIGNNTSTAFDMFMGNMLTRVADMAVDAGKKLVSMSDEFTSNTARLDRMNDGLQTTAELQNMIYDAAQRSRGSYSAMMSTVAQLGNQAGEAFGNNSKQIVAFSELLNKTFTLSGMDTTAIESVMYNMTQSLSSGKLLGQDYRILKQNAPQMISYLRDYFNVTQAGLDDMVSKGQVTSEALKNAMFNAADDINEKFNKMPMTWSQLWTKATNEIQKALEPLLQVINNIAQFIAENWSTIQMVLTALAITIGIVTVAWLAYEAVMIIVKITQDSFNLSLVMTNLFLAALILIVFAVVLALIYFWNTSDEIATKMIEVWDNVVISMESVKVGFMMIFDAIATVCEQFVADQVQKFQKFVNAILSMINIVLDALGEQQLAMNDWGDRMAAAAAEKQANRDKDIQEAQNKVWQDALEREQTRDERVKNRKKIGEGIGDKLGQDFTKGLGAGGLVGSDGKGGKALKTTSNDKLLTDEDIQLLLDVATRDYQLNYQQVTPNIAVTFGDVRETADVDSVLDAVGTKVEELLYGDAEVKN